MGSPAVRYLSTLRFTEDWLDQLRAAVPGVDVRQIPASAASEVPADSWADVDVLHTSRVFPTAGAAPRLRWVQLDTAGVDHIVDLPIWSSPVVITTIGGVSPVPMAEYALMMVLGFSHRMPDMAEAQRRREWPDPDERWARYRPRNLPGSTLGVIGYGRIGSEVGRLARAFGMQVLGVRRSGGLTGVAGTDDPGTEVVGVDHLHEVLARSDHVVVALPLTAATRGLLGRDALAHLRPGTVLVDIGRGGVVDHRALLEALADGRLAGAALDVFPEEPLDGHSPLWDHPAVVVTPHVAGFAPAYEPVVLDLVADNLRRFVTGQPLINRVDRVRGY